jgi:hypothetical protein
MKRLATFIAVLGFVIAAAGSVSAGTAPPIRTASRAVQDQGACGTGVPFAVFYENSNFGGRTSTYCLTARANLTTVHWDDGSCTSDNIFTPADETCTNDQFSSFAVFTAAGSGVCTNSPWHRAILKLFYDINFQPTGTELNYTNSGTHSSMPTGWGDRVSSVSILCQTA